VNRRASYRTKKVIESHCRPSLRLEAGNFPDIDAVWKRPHRRNDDKFISSRWIETRWNRCRL